MRKNLKNLETELLSERKKFKSETDILEEIAVLLRENESERQSIKIALENKSDSGFNAFIFDQLKTDNIFHINQIRKVAIDYRLRFLPSHFFKDGIPEEAITQINRLEKIHNIKLEGFKIMAPTKAFRLLSYDDPLLFAPIGNDYYYLILRWGKDITPIRKWLVKPFKNLWNFVVFCLAVSIALTAVVPENNLSKSVPMATLIIFLFMFKSIVAVLMYAFFMMGKNFNVSIWDRKYFNN
jgi:ABC-type multidrug transport system fused ATPase/permease subunit